MKRPITYRRYIVGLCLVAALQGCGGGGGDGETQSASTASSSPSTSTVSLSATVPSTASTADRVTLQSSASGATSTELSSLSWRSVSGPGEVWLSSIENGNATAEFSRAGTYVLELSMTRASGTLSSQYTITVTRPSEFKARLEGEFPMRTIQSGYVGPRILTDNGDIYLAYIDEDLRTLVRKRPLGTANTWQSATILENTTDEESHRKPAIGMDRNGYIHIVYDMHGSPWKYKVSKNPRDISEWVDYSASQSTGTTDKIPGRQITYPFMAQSPSGDLWMSFRECTDCGNSDFFKRGWSSGLVKYNVDTQRWERPGTTVFAQGETYRPQYLRAWFDFSGKMHLGWIWGLQYTAEEGSVPFFQDPTYPSYAQSDDGGSTFRYANGQAFSLPLTFETSENVISPTVIDPTLSRRSSGYFNYVDDITVDPNGNPIVTVRSHAVRYNPTTGWSDQWDSQNTVPYSGYVYRYNTRGHVVAVSGVAGDIEGINVHESRNDGSTWRRFHVDSTTNNTLASPTYFIDETYFLKTGGEAIRVALAYTKASSAQAVIRVYTVHLPE